MKTLELKASKREVFGKKESKKVRGAEMIPATISGNGETLHISINSKEVKPLIYTPNSYVVAFELDGQTIEGVMREVQFHPVKEEILHMDFYRVVPGKPVAIDVPVKLVGNSEGVKQGGKMILSKRKVKVSGLRENLPDELTVDVTELGLGKSFFVGDLKLENLTVLTPATTAICAVKMTRAARGAAAAAAAAGK